MAVIFGAEESTASNDMKDIVDFEIDIANVRFHDIHCLIMFHLK